MRHKKRNTEHRAEVDKVQQRKASPTKKAADKRRSSQLSNFSVDSRTAALEIDANEEKELLGVVEDVRGFLSRPSGFPTFISRQQVIHELSRVINTPSIDGATKIEGLDLSWQLVETSKDFREASACLEIVLPTVISQLGSRNVERQQAAIKFLQKSIERAGHTQQVLGHLARNGINRRRDQVSVETMKLLPGLYGSSASQMNLTPVIVALYEELDKKDREKFAFASLVRHQELLGSESFEEFSDNASRLDKQKFQEMIHSYGEKDSEAKLMKKRPKDGVSFGIIPNLFINRAIDKTNRHERAEGTTLIRRELEKQKGDLGLLLPYLPSFLRFLSNLLNDSNPKVVLQTLGCHEILIKEVPTSVQKHADQFSFNIMKISLESKPQVKTELYKLMKELMMTCGPMRIVSILLEEISHKNPKMREDILIYVILALLTFPSSEFDMEKLAHDIVPAITDPKRRVRQATLEVLAVMDAGLSHSKDDIIFDTFNNIELQMYDDADLIADAINTRLNRKLLPKITDDGFVEYGLLIPENYFTRSVYTGRGRKSKQSNAVEGNDVEWILMGTGGLSKGSSLANSLGLNGSGGSMGSTISLQSIKSGSSSGQSNREVSDGNRRGSITFTGKAKIPSIKRRTRSDSPTKDRDETRDGNGEERSKASKDPKNSMRRPSKSLDLSPTFEEETGSGSDLDDEETYFKKKYGKKEKVPEIEVPDQENDPADEKFIKEHWKHDERSLSSAEKLERKKRYDTMTRFESLLNLREAAATPPNQRPTQLSELKEDEEADSLSKTQTSNFKRNSMHLMGLVDNEAKFKTLFDDDDRMDDKVAPGAFKDPVEAYRLAKADLKSDEWQTEIDGLDAIVRLVKYHSDIVVEDIKYVMKAVFDECKNLRSQVTRAAIQTLIEMFIHLGRTNEIKTLDEVAQLMLTKTGDTNRFIRTDANRALEALAFNISIYKAVSLLGKLGTEHKNSVARTCVARILADMVEKLGAERVMSETATLEILLNVSVTFIIDGSLETRTEAKRIFAILSKHRDFEQKLEDLVQSKKDLEHARKAIKASK